MNNKLKKSWGVYTGIFLCFSVNVTADIYQNNAFLYGHNIEVGLGSDGAFGSDIPSPDIGRKSYKKQLGYICDATGNRFQASYHGDFFLPGFPEEGWGISLNGKTYNNNSNQQGAEVLGTLSNFKKTERAQSVVWKGEIEDLEIIQTYRVYSAGTAIVIDVSLKNTSDTEMTDVYYMRTVDPDNNAEQDPVNSSAKYFTSNTINSQGSDGNGGSSVSALQAADTSGKFTESLLTLNGYGENSRVIYGGLFNRDPIEVYNGSDNLKQTGTNTADEAISVAFKFDQIKPGDTVTFRTGYQLSDVPVASIDIDADDSSGATGNAFKQLYALGTTGENITDSDIVISNDDITHIVEAVITIMNPHDLDKLSVLGTLPTGISVDSAASTEAKIVLKGSGAKADYQNALKQLQFSNNSMQSSTETRKVTIQLIDSNAAPSNAAVSTIDITVPVVPSDAKVAGDDIVNKAEEGSVPLSGHAAPNSTVVVNFTDKNGKKLTPPKTVTADENGNWSLDADPADISSLSDGPIKVLITATDPNGHKSTFEKEFIKDTNIILTNITPTDNQTASSMTPVFDGETDPNATVTFKILPDGKEYTKVADAEGKWSIPLDKQEMGKTISVQISAKDEAGNEASTSQKLIIPSLPVDIVELDVNDKGIANSTTPTFKGTSNPDTIITVDMPTGNGDSKTCSTTTDAEGKWSCKMPELPSGGPYTVTVTTTDKDGSTNTATGEITIPALPLAIDSPVDKSVISGITPSISGTSKPGTKITVVSSDGKECTATTDDKNHWSCDLPTLPSDTDFTLTVTTEDDIGNKVTEAVNISTEKLPLVIDSPVDKAVISGITPSISGTSKPGTKITVVSSDGKECTATTDDKNHWSCELPTLPSDTDFTLTVTAEDDIGSKATKVVGISTDKLPLSIIAPKDNSTVEDSTPTFVGTTSPNTDVTVTMATGEECKAKSDAMGKWTCELPELTVGGPYDVTITAKDPDGNETSIKEQISVPKIPLVILSPADGGKITDTKVIVKGTSNPNQPIMVLGPDGESCETTANDKGEWSCQLDHLQPGTNKRITVLAGGEDNGKKVRLLAVDIENSSAGVKTILTGGGGSSSIPMLLLLGLLSFFRQRKKLKG